MSYYQDDTVTLHHGDSLDVLRGMPDQSVDCCVTSPPYFGLRDYGVTGQIGAEATPAEFVERLRELFAEVRRVLADDGTCWLNLGDSYAGSWGGQGKSAAENGGMHRKMLEASGYGIKSRTGAITAGMPAAKNMIGIPWRVAFALQDDGWILRNDIIWAKANPMPQSVNDRLASKHEHLFLLAKSRRYWFDLDPIREPVVTTRPDALAWDREEPGVPGQRSQHRPGRTWSERRAAGAPSRRGDDPAAAASDSDFATASNGRNPGDVWTMAASPFAEAHFAVMPTRLAERAILAGCRPGGTVLDPFSGSGTTGMVAIRHGRKYVGVDLNAKYLDLSLRTRLHTATLDFGSAS